jgi:predicted permease
MQKTPLAEEVPDPTSRVSHWLGRLVKHLSPATPLMLVLAIGSAGGAFAVLDAFLWRPLPYQHPHRLVVIRERLLKTGLRGSLVSYQAYHEISRKIPAIRKAGLIDLTGGVATVHGVEHTVFGGRATPSLFRTLDVPPRLGHWLSQASGRPGGPPEALLTYGFWKTAFGGSDRVLGRHFRFRGTLYRIVGVMPKSFYTLYTGADFWLSRALTPTQLRDRNINHSMIARLAPGETLAKLNAALAAFRNRLLARVSPAARQQSVRDGWAIDAVRLHDHLVKLYLGGHPEFLLILALIALVLLVIAIVNSVNLELVRARRRASDLAVRRALGASTSDLFRLMLGDNLLMLLAVVAGALIFGALLTDLFQALIRSALAGPVTVSLPFLIRFGKTAGLFTAAAGAILVSGIFLAALGYAGRESLLAPLLHEAGGQGTAHGARLLRRGFGSLQIVMATFLVLIGLLLTQSLLSILGRPLHFNPAGRLETLAISPRKISLPRFWREAKPALKTLPGIRSVAVGAMVPFNGVVSSRSVIRAPNRPHESLYVYWIPVSRGYFRTLGIPLLAGRSFTGAEERQGAPAVIVSARLAKRLFHATGIVGRTLGRKHPARIVGVASSVAWKPTPDTHIVGTVYTPLYAPLYHDSSVTNVILQVRAISPALEQTIRTTLERTIPGTAVTHFTALSALVHASDRLFESLAEITAAFGLVALFLTIFGVYALTAQTSLNRRQEYAIRSALGATPASVSRLVLTEAFWMLGSGLLAGLLLSLLLTHLLEGALYGVGVVNVPADLVGVLLIVATTLAASWIPVRDTFRAGLTGSLRPGAA